MNKKFYVLITVFAFVLNIISPAFAATKVLKAENSVNQIAQLAALLPASDGVMTLDVRRLMSESLPQMLATRPQFLTALNSKLDEIKAKTGIDLRQFENIAVGVAYKKVSAAQTDLEPVILARGSFNSGAFLGVAKVAAQGKYREEKIGDRTVYIFSPKDIVPKKTPPTKPPGTGIFDRMMQSLSNEVALTSYDNNTLVIGSLARLRETVGNKPSANAELLALVNRKPASIMSFAANTPAGLSQFIKLDDDEIGKNLNSIRQLYGAFDFAGGSAILSAVGKTAQPAEAQSLEEMLSGLQMIGKGVLSGQSGDKAVYGRLIEAAVISRTSNEVLFDLKIPQTDVDALMGILLK